MTADSFHDEASGEQCPLLSPLSRRPSHSDSISAPRGRRGTTTKPSPFRIIALSFVVVSLLQLSYSFVDPAFSELQEGIICRQHFDNVSNPAGDPRCKSPEIQSDLSMLQAVEMTSAFTPACSLSIIYGIGGEKFGRRPMLRFASFGIMLLYPVDLIIYRFPEIFDIRSIWPAAFVVTSVGGGIQILTAFIYTIISDVTTSAQRTNIFFYMTAVLVATPLLGNPLSYFAMKGGPWLAGSIGAFCNSLAFVITLAIPETKHVEDAPQDIQASCDARGESRPEHSARSAKKMRDDALVSIKKGLHSVTTLLWAKKRMSVVLFATLFTRIGTYVNVLLMQYIAKKFSYSWSEANLAVSIKWLCKLVLTLLILPLVGQKLLQATGSPLRRDLIISRYSIVFAIVGTLGIGLSSNPVFLFANLVPYSLLEGFATCTRSLLSQLAGDDERAVLFSVISLLENLGSLSAGPFMAYTFRFGLRWGEQWYGLPFVVAGLLFCVAAVIIWVVRFDDRDVADREQEE